MRLAELWLNPEVKTHPLSPEALEHERKVVGLIAGRVIEGAEMSKDGRTVRFRLGAKR